MHGKASRSDVKPIGAHPSRSLLAGRPQLERPIEHSTPDRQAAAKFRRLIRVPLPTTPREGYDRPMVGTLDQNSLRDLTERLRLAAEAAYVVALESQRLVVQSRALIRRRVAELADLYGEESVTDRIGTRAMTTERFTSNEKPLYACRAAFTASAASIVTSNGSKTPKRPTRRDASIARSRYDRRSAIVRHTKKARHPCRTRVR